MDSNKPLYQVNLTLTSDDDQQLRTLTDQIRKESGGETGWIRLGNLLVKIGQFNKAQDLYNVLLEQASNNSDKASCYNNLGYIKYQQGDNTNALLYYVKALEIRQKILPPNHHDLATSYSNIGLVYINIGEHSKALIFLKKELEIREKTLPSNDRSLATCYNNI
ncbi:unnamed protein product, partial [Rotaria sp. Silwood1]